MRVSTEIIYEFSSARSDPRTSKPVEPTREDIEWLFTALFEAYGPRQWWPTVHGGAFELILGAILVQNIAWSNTERALVNLHRAGIWTFQAILDTRDEQMHDLIRPSGYYKAKTRKLKEFASFILEKYEGDLDRLFALPVDEMRVELLSVWGIGEETADDIIVYGAKKPSFVIDAYTKRLCSQEWVGKSREKATPPTKNCFTTTFRTTTTSSTSTTHLSTTMWLGFARRSHCATNARSLTNALWA